MCLEYRILGEHTQGGFAEYCRIPAVNLERLPDHIGYTEAAALPVAYTTAWRSVYTVGRLQPHERVLVLGASGGVGCAAVQIARRLGSFVFAVTAGGEKMQKLRALGASFPIDRCRSNFREIVLAETDGRGVDLVVNPVGGETWQDAVRSLSRGGRMVLCGATIGDSINISMREIYNSHRRILPGPLGNRRDFRSVLDLVSRGELKPVVHSILPLEEISEGHRLIEEAHVVGKIVIAP
jgi:NADPH:quinone reductase-like Zn-dependent oxidoreductase